MRKIFLLLFILVSFQVYAFESNQLKGIKCSKTQYHEEDFGEQGTYDENAFYEKECTLDSSVTLESLYDDIINNISKELLNIYKDNTEFTATLIKTEMQKFKAKYKKENFGKTFEYSKEDNAGRTITVSIEIYNGGYKIYYKRYYDYDDTFTVSKNNGKITLTHIYHRS